MGSLRSDYVLYKRLSKLMVRHWAVLCISISCMSISAVTDPLLSWLMRPIIDGNFVQHTNHMWLMPLLLLALFGVRAFTNFVNITANAHVVYCLIEELRQLMFQHIQNIPLAILKKIPSSVLVSRMTFDAMQLSELGMNALSVIVRDTITIIGLYLVLIWNNVWLTLLVMSVIPIIALSFYAVSCAQRRLGRAIQEDMGTYTQILSENIQLQEIIRLYDGQEEEKKHIVPHTKKIRQRSVTQMALGAANSSIVQLAVACGLSAVLYYATILAHAHTFTPGMFVSFITAMILLFAPFRRLTTVGYLIQRGLAAAESIFQTLDIPVERKDGTVLPMIQGRITFEQVSFQYPASDQVVLSDVSFSITPGEKIAIVGESGSGKSTILQLIVGMYEPSAGRILIDSHDIQSINLKCLRAAISFVGQDHTLFHNTLKHNVAYGALRHHAIEHVLCCAAAQDFVAKLPQNYHTHIGTHGVALSGGQKQRVHIARALLKNAPILLLDEATSALDDDTKTRIRWHTQDTRSIRTDIVVTHHLSEIEKADRIFFLQKGRIVESGSHQELLLNNGPYTSLYFAQQVATNLA